MRFLFRDVSAPRACASRGSRSLRESIIRGVERALVGGARLAWPAIQKFNARFEGKPLHPKWAPAPLLKKSQKTFPQLGWPRTTDSLCPRCVKEVRTEI